jgi:D-threo-aldose 1-dehydrogenase
VSDGWIRRLGATGLNVSAVCAGGGPLGSMPAAFGYEVSESDAIDLVEALLASPIRFLDTSNGYSEGESERRIGKGIGRAACLPADYLVATKVDALDGDYSGARVRESVRESKERLGLDSLPLVHLHDPEFHEFGTLTAPGGAVETLVRLRDEGEIGHIGVAGGDVHELARYLDLGVFDVLLTHNRWTIVDRSAGPLIDQAIAGGVAVLNAAVYGGGILAAPAAPGTNYGYRPAGRSTVEAIAAMSALSAAWNTDLATVALQHSLRDDRISSTVVGFSKVSRIASIMDAVDSPLPAEFWAALEQLVPDRSQWLDAK